MPDQIDTSKVPTENFGSAAAIAWLRSTAWSDRPHPIVIHLRRAFGLSGKAACEVLAAASRPSGMENAAPVDEAGAALGTAEIVAATSLNTITRADNFASVTTVGAA